MLFPQATQTIIDFVNSFLDAENITTQSGVLKELEASRIRLKDLQKEAAAIAAVETSNLKDSGAVQQQQLSTLTSAISAEKMRTEELSVQLRLLEEQKAILDDAKTQQGGEIGGSTKAPTGKGVGTGDEIQAIIDRFKDRRRVTN